MVSSVGLISYNYYPQDKVIQNRHVLALLNPRVLGLLALLLIASVILTVQCKGEPDELEIYAGDDKLADVNEPVEFNDAMIVSPSPLNSSCTYAFYWDFDDMLDMNLDGIRDNDNDSGERYPEYTYHDPLPRVHVVTLTVRETDGTSERVAKDTLKVIIDTPWIDELRTNGDTFLLQEPIHVSLTVRVVDETIEYPWSGTLKLQLQDPYTSWKRSEGEWEVSLNSSGSSVTFTTDVVIDYMDDYILAATLLDYRQLQVDKSSIGLEVIDVIYNPPPSPVIDPYDGRVQVGEPARFNGSRSEDVNGFIASYSWDMGDGMTQTGIEVTHVYSIAGNYTVTLTVVDNEGERGTSEVMIEVYSPAPVIPNAQDNGTVPSPGDQDIFIPDPVTTLAIFLIVSFGILCATEFGKTSILFLLIPLYTRIHKKEVLDQFTRGKVYGYVIANPGDHYSSIKSSLNISNGALAYHLQVLERESLIKSRRDGVYRRFYPIDMRVPSGGWGLKESQLMIIEKIRETPGISQRDIASFLGISSSTVSYHMEELLRTGLVIKERQGMRLRYYLSPGSGPTG